MSVARITTVKSSRKPYDCGKCRKHLPVGSPYRWYKVGFRSRRKNIRCTDSACTPRTSELESSKLSEVYAAQEEAEDSVDSIESADDCEDILSTFAAAVREVADEYEEASTDDNGNVFNTAAEERAEALNSAADEIEGISIDEVTTECEDCDGHGEIDCAECNGGGTHVESCAECDGEGQVDEDDCEACGGSGETDEDCTGCDGSGNVECTNEDCDNGQVPDLDGVKDQLRDAINEVDFGC